MIDPIRHVPQARTPELPEAALSPANFHNSESLAPKHRHHGLRVKVSVGLWSHSEPMNKIVAKQVLHSFHHPQMSTKIQGVHQDIWPLTWTEAKSRIRTPHLTLTSHEEETGSRENSQYVAYEYIRSLSPAGLNLGKSLVSPSAVPSVLTF